MTDRAELERFYSSVRLPSHVDPPFRAQQFWNDNRCVQLLTATTFRFQTNWGGQAINATLLGRGQGPRVPSGHRAELVWLAYQVLDINAFTLIPCDIPLTVIRNGTAVSGFVNMKPGFGLNTDGGSLTTSFRSIVVESPRVCVPIHFDEGDTCDLEVANVFDPGAVYLFDLRWCGWVYPIAVEGEAGSIRQTLQDPGAAAPLGSTQAVRRPRR